MHILINSVGQRLGYFYFFSRDDGLIHLQKTTKLLSYTEARVKDTIKVHIFEFIAFDKGER